MAYLCFSLRIAFERDTLDESSRINARQQMTREGSKVGRGEGREGTYLCFGLRIALGRDTLDESGEEMLDGRVAEGLGGLGRNVAVEEVAGGVLGMRKGGREGGREG